MTRHPGGVGRSYPAHPYDHAIDEAARYEAQIAYERNAIDDVDTSGSKPVVIGFLFLLVAIPAITAGLCYLAWEAIR